MKDVEFYINNVSVLPDEKLAKYGKLFDRSEIMRFHQSLPGYQPTPLYSLPELAPSLNIKELWVKDESERMGLKAFKVLGASYAIKNLMQQIPSNAVLCTATDGNHGRAVAWAAALFDKKAVIFIPESSAQLRKWNIEKEGAKVIEVSGDYDDAVDMARKQSEENGWTLVQDSSFDDYEDIPLDIMSGYTTILKEMEREIHTPRKPQFDIVILKAGVGSWAAAAVWYYHNKYRENRPKIVLVEPSSADCCMESMKNGRLSHTQNSLDTMMVGLNCGTPSKVAFDILKDGVDLFITIPDYYAGAAMMALYFSKGEDPQIISGETGAAGLGGLIALQHEEKLREGKDFIGLSSSSRVLVFNTEGNTDPENFNRIIHGE
jgi:diaminopropionate ammonia-lyase